MKKTLGLCLAGYTISWGSASRLRPWAPSVSGSDHYLITLYTTLRFVQMCDTQTLYPWFVHCVALRWRLVLGREFLGFTLLLRRGGKSSLQRLPENKHYFSKLKSRSNGAALCPTVSPVLTSSAIANLRQYCCPCWESSMYAAFNQWEEDDNNFHLTTFGTPWENQIQAPVKSFSLSRYAPPGLRPSENRINNYEEGIVRL